MGAAALLSWRRLSEQGEAETRFSAIAGGALVKNASASPSSMPLTPQRPGKDAATKQSRKTSPENGAKSAQTIAIEPVRRRGVRNGG
jgi:hypothetical protein